MDPKLLTGWYSHNSVMAASNVNCSTDRLVDMHNTIPRFNQMKSLVRGFSVVLLCVVVVIPQGTVGEGGQ